MPGARRDAAVSPERFAAERAAAWEELEAALRRAGERPEKLGRDGVRRLGTLYRAAAADLAFARRRFPGEPLVGRLERSCCGRGRRSTRARGGACRCRPSSPAGTGGGWRSGRCWCWSRGAAAGPALAGGAWGAVDPAAAAGLIPAEFQAAADPPAEGRDFDAADLVRVLVPGHDQQHPGDAVAFAGGITFGVADGLRAVLQRAAAGSDRRAVDRGGNGDRVPAADLLARAAGDLVHRRGRDRGAADRVGADPAGPLRRATSLRREASPGGRARGGDGPRGSCCAGFLRGLRDRSGAAGRGSGRARLRRCSCCSGASCTGAAARVRAPRAPSPAGRRRRASRAAGPAAPRARARRPRGPAPRRARAPARTSPATVARGAVERSSPAPAASASSAGSDGLATTTAWRRVSTGTARTSGRAAASSSRSQKTTTSARLLPSARRNASS